MTRVECDMERGKRKIQAGVVVSDKMQKTIVVKVERRVRHPVYEKVMRQFSKFKAHDERREAQVGDLVQIMETRPMSKDKRWRLVKIVRRGMRVTEATRPSVREEATAVEG